MSREWKPGDVANILTGGEQRAFRTTKGWTYIDGSTSPIEADNYAPRSPLVVIDPEDREQVERLEAALAEAGVWPVPHNEPRVRYMQAALREFADPKPPKPEEPTGLGAVVEDRWGHVFVRTGDRAWRNVNEETFCIWLNIDAVRVLSEGVQP